MQNIDINKLFTQLNLNHNYYKNGVKITSEHDEYMRKSAVNHDELFKREQIFALVEFILKYHPDCMKRTEFYEDERCVDIQHTSELIVFTKEEFKKVVYYIKNSL